MTKTTKTNATKKPERSVKVVRLGDAVILWITAGAEVTAYRVTALQAQFGQAAFRLQKADKGDGTAEVYEVLLDGPRSTCECRGFLRYGMCADGKGCRHIASLNAAIASGQLPIAVATPEPIAQPADEKRVEVAVEPPAPRPQPAYKYTPIPGREHDCIYGPCHDEDAFGFCAI